MNVYQCWYRGLSGYCCRSYNSKWMFIPELGQIDNRIHRKIALNDLVFDNIYAKRHELEIEKKLNNFTLNPFHLLKKLFFATQKPNTIGGMLFASP